VLLAAGAFRGVAAPQAPPAAPAGMEELPLDVHPQVSGWVRRFVTDQRATFQRLLHRRPAYEAVVEGELRRRGMPEELFNVAMLESGLSASAVSGDSTAVGLWQFVVPTAQQYGLRVDEWIDERRDPVRATRAALEYLEWLHERYDSWYLAAAAYNAGPARVDSVLARHGKGGEGDDAYWEVQEHLPWQTREYVPRLVAASLLARDPSAHGFEPGDAPPFEYERVFMPGSTELARVARVVGVPRRELERLNPHLMRGVTPPGEVYPVRVPIGSGSRLLAGRRVSG